MMLERDASSRPIKVGYPNYDAWFGGWLQGAALTLAWLGLGLMALAPVAVQARALEAAEKAELEKSVTAFDAAIRGSDFERVIAFMPPKILEQFASKSGVELGKLKASIVARMRETMSSVSIVKFTLDLEKAEHKALADGAPYVLIPTETIIRVGKLPGKAKQVSKTLAFIDGGKWYLLRVENTKRAETLRQAYPAFTGVEIPPGTMEVLPQ